jgi:hypothetical protein
LVCLVPFMLSVTNKSFMPSAITLTIVMHGVIALFTSLS